MLLMHCDNDEMTRFYIFDTIDSKSDLSHFLSDYFSLHFLQLSLMNLSYNVTTIAKHGAPRIAWMPL